MSSRINNLAHLKIPLESILSATNNFDDTHVTGRSGYEKIYKGQFSWTGEFIVINARRYSKDGDEMFWTELSMLSSLKHQNLVSLLGFCYENGEKIVITRDDIMGSLSNHLSDATLLTWVQRLKISVGLAHALSYIHYDKPRDFSVIHRDITSSTVLLNDNFEPKLYFFERSMKVEASQRHHSFHTSKVLWSRNGYTDPTYEKTNSVNHKTDMYSFRIVLFELLCGRKSIIADDTNKYLAPAAIFHYKEKKLKEIVDCDLWKQMDAPSFDIFAEIAYDCLNEELSQRPYIDEIVPRLEKALELARENRPILPKEVSNFDPQVIQSMVTESLEHEFLAKESSQPQSSYEASASLIEFELKKIIFDKMDKSKSYLASPEHKECYDRLIKSYDLDKSIFSTYGKVYSLKRSQKDKDKDEDRSAISD
ncbi:kinase-like domain, phloem protein 2-like protein [Tanacetum coccineum]